MTRKKTSIKKILTLVFLIVGMLVGVIIVSRLFSFPIFPDRYCDNWNYLKFESISENMPKCPLGCTTVKERTVIKSNGPRIYSQCYGWGERYHP